jgi:hypothetical protein
MMGSSVGTASFNPRREREKTMANERSSESSLERRTFAFVSGSPEQQAEQTSAIRNDRTGPWVQPSDSDFFSDWDEMEKKFHDCNCLVFTDLAVIPGNCAEVADRLYRCTEHHIEIWPLNEEQYELLKPRQWYRRGDKERVFSRERICWEWKRQCENGWQEEGPRKEEQ